VRSHDLDRFNDLWMPDAAVLLFIVDPASHADTAAAWMIQAYRLTQTEAKVALAVASGLGIPQAAHRLDVSINTIKSHLRQVFAKTGTSRQAELARMMSSIALLRGTDACAPDAG